MVVSNNDRLKVINAMAWHIDLNYNKNNNGKNTEQIF